MDVGKASEILVIMLSPTLAIGAALYAPRGMRAIRRFVARRRADASPQPINPPIEQLASDLRRLLRQHDAVKQSTGVAMRVQHLRAVEGAITDCAIDAAQALGVPCPPRPTRGPLATPELRRLLLSLMNAGLVLPPAVNLLGADKRL